MNCTIIKWDLKSVLLFQRNLVGLLLLFDEFQLIFSHFSFSFFPNRSKLILDNIFGRLQKLFIVNLLFSVKVDHIIRHIALIHPRNKQLLLQFKMLLVMFFPLLFSTYRWLYLFYATSQHFILFLELLLFLVNQKQRLFNRRISFFTFLSHFNQQSSAIINIQKANQHLFILYLPQSLFFQQGFIFIIKRLTFPFRCDYFIGIPWVIEMLVVRLLLLV